MKGRLFDSPSLLLADAERPRAHLSFAERVLDGNGWLWLQGLPHETVSWWFPMPDFKRQIGLAVIVCLIDVLESISIAKALAYRNQYDLM